jgi:glycosyltransferase involved in cell wall biosynthesis
MENSNIKLSYILVTRNKLPYLKPVLATLMANKKDDEEIVVVDGASSDETPEYLRGLFNDKKIDQYVSEPDQGQSHAINKGMLMAKGDLLKILNDDDEYFYDEIEKCKQFLLTHPEIDALGSNGIQNDGQEYHREEDFLAWKNTHRPFQIAEQGMMFRKYSIALFGLADAATVYWEGEFTLRLTSGKARLAWYTGITWKHTFNKDSVSVLRPEIWKDESAKLRRIYPNLYSKWKHFVPKPIRNLIRYFIPKKRLVTEEQVIKPTFLY